MAPKTGRKFTSARKIIMVMQHMSKGSTFTFNGRKEPLVVTSPAQGTKFLAKIPERENATEHQFVWEGEVRPKHKPRPGQTNNVNSLTVHSYGISDSGEVTRDELNAIGRAHYQALRDDPYSGEHANWEDMRNFLSKDMGITHEQATELFSRANRHGQLYVVDSRAGIRADEPFPGSRPYVRLEID